MPDWEPAPPSVRLNGIADLLKVSEFWRPSIETVRELAADVAAMERDLAKLRAALAHRDGLDARLREERADG